MRNLLSVGDLQHRAGIPFDTASEIVMRHPEFPWKDHGRARELADWIRERVLPSDPDHVLERVSQYVRNPVDPVRDGESSGLASIRAGDLYELTSGLLAPVPPACPARCLPRRTLSPALGSRPEGRFRRPIPVPA
jgi:hypothetical protein